MTTFSRGDLLKLELARERLNAMVRELRVAMGVCPECQELKLYLLVAHADARYVEGDQPDHPGVEIQHAG